VSVTGQYHNQAGVTGEAVWGKRSPWVTLTGTLANEPVTLTLLDHPKNLTYPTYWHARGYGLFAANPLAPSVFSNGADAALNYTLKAGQAVTFRYRLVIASGGAESPKVLAEEFGAGK
jgi:Methane oxygenase PmoA